MGPVGLGWVSQSCFNGQGCVQFDFLSCRWDVCNQEIIMQFKRGVRFIFCYGIQSCSVVSLLSSPVWALNVMPLANVGVSCRIINLRHGGV